MSDDFLIINEAGLTAEDGWNFQSSRSAADKIFREMAIRDTSSVDNAVANLLAIKFAQVKNAHPELNDVEAYIVAGRLVKQTIRCYMAAVDQLLP